MVSMDGKNAIGKKPIIKPVKNADLWCELDQGTHRHTVKWHWVKGHSGHTENDLVDSIANQAIDDLLCGGNTL